MDTVVHSALEEICCGSSHGLLLADLWPKINSSLAARDLPLCSNVKRAVWENLVEVPGLEFSSPNGVVSREDLGNLRVEDCEEMDVKIVAPEAMRRSFLGVSEVAASESTNLSVVQQKILELLAAARSNGFPQSELSKELRMEPNYLSYPLTRLETQGLIVRQPSIIRQKHPSNEREDKVVTTNMVYLYRYGKHLSCQQRLEITKDSSPLLLGNVDDDRVESFDDLGGEIGKEEVQVKDFLPDLKAICDKLEKAPGKVLVVSDLKLDLGYRGTSGHRAWRNVCRRLEDARFVEKCCTMINGKKVDCLRLLRGFSPENFESKLRGRGKGDLDVKQPTNMTKRRQATEQIVELPIVRQIYEMVDSAGPKGLTIIEVCRRLGLCIKEYHKQYSKQMISRFGLQQEPESHNRGEIYRVWTAGNFNRKSNDVGSTKRETLPQVVNEPDSLVTDWEFQEDFPQPLQVLDKSHPVENVMGTNESESNASVLIEASNISTVKNDDPSTLLLECNPHHSDSEEQNEVHNSERQQDSGTVTDNNQLQTCPSDAVTPSRRRSYPRHMRLASGATSSTREQHILRMLQEDEFLVKPELHRRLEGLANETMDRDTLHRCLMKLQKEGHCKCIHMSVPGVTNCGRSKTTLVVLHPSVDKVSPELVGRIHDRIRSFEVQVRRQSHAQEKDRAVPLLDNVQRIPNNVRLDNQSERAKMMRANGFIPAKMIRTKLLHIFLWSCVCNSPNEDDALQSSNQSNDLKNPHNSWKLFPLDVAIKSMPLELFLQVVGSVHKIENMLEKCRSGSRLCDLPSKEYKSIMDTLATGRLSWLIDVLRRLRLIRLVSEDHTEGEASRTHTILTHALELKPYIEEPGKAVGSSGFLFPDFRPQVRHDFILSSRTAVDEYWNTLEYCYAEAKAPAALLSFPGSAVHEVFHLNSWDSVREMTTDQRAELLKRVTYDDPKKKIAFSECKKIAKELNLTFEQVLRVYHDKRRQRIDRNQRGCDAEGHETQLDSRKRKRRTDRVSSPPAKVSGTEFQLHLDVENYDDHSQDREDDSEDQIAPELNEDDKETSTFIRRRALSRLNSARKKKFSWTEEADRELVIEYARYRAARGVKFNGVLWSSIENLPGPPDSCKRRMALLRSYVPFNKALLKLCSLLAGRYAKHLENFQGKILSHGDSESRPQGYSFEEDMCSSSYVSEKWDDFEDDAIKVALDNALRYKRMAKLEAGRDTFSGRGKKDDVFDNGDTKRKSRSRQLPRQYAKLLNRSASISRRMQESVAIANAAELFKLIFLSNTRAPEVPTFLAETLRYYSEHDLFAAFSYLREKKIMIGGGCNSPFSLSQHFLHGILSSIFPRDTGKRVAKFTSWLNEREKDLMEDGLDLPSNLQCGEVFTLCALLSSGELSLFSYLPEEGVGEAEDNRKRKNGGCVLDGGKPFKKSKSSFVNEDEIISRREKGFPGIKLRLHYETIPKLLVIDSFKDGPYPATFFSGNGPSHSLSAPDVNCSVSENEVADYMKEIHESGTIIYHTVSDVNDSPWEAMARYAEHLVSSDSYKEETVSFNPNSFRMLYSAIQKSGDNGLSMDDIREVMRDTDEKMSEVMIEVLEAFGRTRKVNAFDSIHIVDSLYLSKYFLTHSCDYGTTRLKGPVVRKDDEHTSVDHNNHKDDIRAFESETNINTDDEVHRVTILNLPKDDSDPPTKILPDTKTNCYPYSRVTSCDERTAENLQFTSSNTQRCSPLLPWMNGDGTINERVYKGLIRRVLGIVMQNPGILEDGIINQMSGLNPQSCRKLLELMVMDNHIITRKMQQMTTQKSQPPNILLSSLFGESSRKSKLVCRVHYFANPMNTNYL